MSQILDFGGFARRVRARRESNAQNLVDFGEEQESQKRYDRYKTEYLFKRNKNKNDLIIENILVCFKML